MPHRDEVLSALLKCLFQIKQRVQLKKCIAHCIFLPRDAYLKESRDIVNVVPTEEDLKHVMIFSMYWLIVLTKLAITVFGYF